jgi:hypothetical protein
MPILPPPQPGEQRAADKAAQERIKAYQEQKKQEADDRRRRLEREAIAESRRRATETKQKR